MRTSHETASYDATVVVYVQEPAKVDPVGATPFRCRLPRLASAQRGVGTAFDAAAPKSCGRPRLISAASGLAPRRTDMAMIADRHRPCYEASGIQLYSPCS